MMLAAMLFRRLPGLAYRHKMSVFAVASIFLVVVYFAVASGLFCTTFEPWSHLNKLCSEFRKRRSVGDMCATLCSDGGIEQLMCIHHSGQAPAFGATLRGGTGIVIKSASRMGRSQEFHWIDSDGKEGFPSEDQYVSLVRNRVKARLNWTLEDQEARRLTHFPGGQTSEDRGSDLRNLEMREVWGLLHNHEYLMSMLHSRRDIFADLVGSCGQYYMTERLSHPLMDHQAEGLDTSFESWAARVHLAVGILELVEQLDEDDILLCDVRPIHFGVTTGGKVKLSNLEGTLLRRVADAMTSSGPPCSIDSDCSLIDCRSTCNLHTRVCDSPIVSTNLQVICEKIFLGWSLPDRIITPGLLMTFHTPQSLLSLLRQCAAPPYNSDSPLEKQEILRHVTQRLDDALTELDRSLEMYRS